MTDERPHADQEQETIQGIADYLRRENPDLDRFEAWTEALDIYRVQFNREVVLPRDE